MEGDGDDARRYNIPHNEDITVIMPRTEGEQVEHRQIVYTLNS